MLVPLLLAIVLVSMHVVSMALAAAAVGARVTEVRLFYGPGLTLRAAAPRIVVGVIPAGGHVQCQGQGDNDPDAAERFEDLPAWRRALVFLSGNVVLLTLATLLLGPDAALTAIARLPAQLVSLTDPRGAAQALLEALAHKPWLAALGTLAAKVGAFNLLPLASLNGWSLVRLLLPPSVGKKLELPWLILSTLLLLALSGLTLFALASFALR